MNQYPGAVFFVDMLGIGALTQNQISLNDVDFEAWNLKQHPAKSENLLCGRLLTVFRACLASLKNHHKSVKIAQLSDCAYVWSSDPNAVLNAARDFMWSSVEAGILSRGGISYGEIVEPGKINRSIGQFIVGEAVTRAVGLEKLGKGCRVFVDDTFLKKIFKGGTFSLDAFKVLKSPLDGTIVNEFCWYAIDGIDCRWAGTPHVAAVEVFGILTRLQYSPRFRWNDSTRDGRVQVACSVESISSFTPNFIGNGNYLFSVDDYVRHLTSPAERSEFIYQRSLSERLADIDRFFFEGRLKDPLQRWMDRT